MVAMAAMNSIVLMTAPRRAWLSSSPSAQSTGTFPQAVLSMPAVGRVVYTFICATCACFAGDTYIKLGGFEQASVHCDAQGCLE